MFLTIHAASAIIIGQATDNMYLGFTWGVVSHFIFDVIPHGDQELGETPGTFTKRDKKVLGSIGAADIVIMLIMLGILYYLGYVPLTPALIATLIGALLPDFINAVYMFTHTRLLKPYFAFQNWTHHAIFGFTVQLRTGFAIQLFTLGVLIWWITHLT